LLWDFEKRMAYSSLDMLFILRNYGGQITENEKGELFCMLATERKMLSKYGWGKSEGNGPIGRQGNKINMDLRELGWEGVNRIHFIAPWKPVAGVSRRR